MTGKHPRIPTCTYRLQFSRWFTFSQARAIVPYLQALGVSDVYASPYFQASPDSLHGYDITDHNKLNAAIGSRGDYDAWIAELHAHRMGQVLDFVPNHVGIADSRNRWWMDVLENGPSSRYAPYFDIEWHPLKFDLRDKVLLPILSDQYGRVLERCELQVCFEEGTFYLLYGERRLPIAPGTYRYILEIALQNLSEHKEEDFYAELQSILTALEYLPKRTETDPKRVAERVREKEVIKRRLERRCAEAPQVQHAIEKALARVNGEPGDPRGDGSPDRSSGWPLFTPRIFRENSAALRESAGDRPAPGWTRHLHGRGKNPHWRRTPAEGLAGARDHRLRFCQSGDAVAGRFLS